MGDQQELQRYDGPAQVAGDEGVRILNGMSKEELIRIIIDDAKNWLAHDGLWFQAVEKGARHGGRPSRSTGRPGAPLR